MTIDKQTHFIAVPLSAWGHLRPCLHLVLNLLALHPSLRLSLVLSPSSFPRIESELKSASLSHLHSPRETETSTPDGPVPPTESVLERLQLVRCSSKSTDPTTALEYNLEDIIREAEDFASSLPTFLSALLKGEDKISPTVDDVEDTAGPQVNKFAHLIPSFLIFDGLRGFVVGTVKALCTGLAVPLLPIFVFLPFNATATYHHFAKEEQGGLIPKMLREATELTAAGEDPIKAYQWGYGGEGKLVNMPGLAPRYDYEWYPLAGTVPSTADALKEFSKSDHHIRGQDTTAIILPFTAELEPEAARALEAELGKPILMVGPQFPDNVWHGGKPEKEVTTASSDDGRVLDFLDRMKAKHGSKSVCYVSFGSFLYPLFRPDLIVHLLTTLHDSGIPILFAHASSMAPKIPDGLPQSLIQHEDVCVVKFAPEWQVLNHDAVSFFVTHCGSNSSAEAIIAEVPIVSMPFVCDQGEYAFLLTERYKVGVDLKQVKTFKGRQEKYNKLYDGTIIVGTEEAIKAEMNETWKRLKGDEGVAMRERMKGLKGMLKDSWEGGQSRKAMTSFDKFL